jgi:hypothetical protein
MDLAIQNWYAINSAISHYESNDHGTCFANGFATSLFRIQQESVQWNTIISQCSELYCHGGEHFDPSSDVSS